VNRIVYSPFAICVLFFAITFTAAAISVVRNEINETRRRERKKKRLGGKGLLADGSGVCNDFVNEKVAVTPPQQQQQQQHNSANCIECCVQKKNFVQYNRNCCCRMNEYTLSNIVAHRLKSKFTSAFCLQPSIFFSSVYNFYFFNHFFLLKVRHEKTIKLKVSYYQFKDSSL
jgi:hypothetical protein